MRAEELAETFGRLNQLRNLFREAANIFNSGIFIKEGYKWIDRVSQFLMEVENLINQYDKNDWPQDNFPFLIAPLYAWRN